MDISTVIENISDQNLRSNTLKKSILIGRSGDSSEFKGDNSKAQIQWKEVPDKMEERKVVKTGYPVLGILASRGYRWHYIHDTMLRLRCEEIMPAKHSDEDIQGARKKAFNSLIQDLGSGVLQICYNKNADLTLDQQMQLEILKHKVRSENNVYLRRHPEIGIMVKLVYAALFNHQPQNPNQFVSDYVHHLNKHREELVVEDVDIPFDQPVITEEITSEEEDRRYIREFAHKLVENCLNLATLGQSYVDVMGIINLMLKSVSPSDDRISIQSSISNAEVAVSEILMTLLTSVAIQKSTSAELVADELMEVILSNTLPYLQRGSQVHEEMRGSVEQFIHSLLEQLTNRVVSRLSITDIMNEVDGKGKSILKKELLSFQEDEQLRNRMKVKFQSL